MARTQPLLIGGLAAGGLIAAFAGEVPRFTPGGSVAIERAPLRRAGPNPILLKKDARVVVEGDSNSAGSRVGGAGMAFPALLGPALQNRIMVTNRAIGGARVRDWPRAPRDVADLYVIMLGTNDAAPRGLFSAQPRTSIDFFENRLKSLTAERQRAGGQVLLLAPPPVASAALDKRVNPYREATRNVALQTGVSFADPAEALSPRNSQAALQYDALHLTAFGQRLVAEWLADRLAVAPGATSGDQTRGPQ